ncbi:hypothetical protein LTR56_012699 [Elasticomyces elasticus]|nr:hypothetical protein LTR22_022667 [Elasticomyces elasticus]KAK3638976.1 hypothetical protein LTR56_012699 [Elasticomyces elasticus]KAK4918770.1 hypothetical protein LTR49_013557 [Elasticomyces elasticus]KAK5754401.1 hypothetical protein LTS12_015470 [Elasticomyces elasticus]
MAHNLQINPEGEATLTRLFVAIMHECPEYTADRVKQYQDDKRAFAPSYKVVMKETSEM